ncbi:MAG: thiopeptide-type bacteriocin biosynthesis protein [Pseudonocardiaceae bacterium]
MAIRTPACELLLPGLATLADDLAEYYDSWFWLRYHTPGYGPHIRACFYGDPATLGSRVLPALSAWVQDMIRQRLSGGFTVEPYDQEIERYGGPAAIGAAEHVFAADSSLVLAILANVSDRDQRLVIAAVSAAAIVCPMTDAYHAALDGRHGHPSGTATTGMAHGIAGPVSLLATAHAAGWSVAGQRAAIQSAAHWLLRWRKDAAHSWAPSVTGDELDSDTPAATAGRRDAWCYGAPGIGRALILAGSVLADPQLLTVGEAAIASLADRAADLWDVEGPTLCHGYAGVLQSAITSHSDTGDSAATAVTEAFDPQLTFAFRHLHNGLPSDAPGVLTGSAGVALALADHGQLPAPPVPTRWDALLLFS